MERPTKEGLKHHPRENILEIPERVYTTLLAMKCKHWSLDFYIHSTNR